MASKSHPSKTWGLTGGIASGKSTAAGYFAEQGVPVIDADQIARDLSSQAGEAHPLILKRFGTVDRAALRDLVFQNDKNRKDLEAILHPLIVRESQKQMDAFAKKGAKIVIYEATLLVETGRNKDLDGLIVVHSPRELRKKRLISRSSFSEELAEQILNAQIQDDLRLKAATVVIENNSSLHALREKVLQFLVAQGVVTS